jgi:hypothetical protein
MATALRGSIAAAEIFAVALRSDCPSGNVCLSVALNAA